MRSNSKSYNNRVKLQKYEKKKLKVIHDSSSDSTENSFEIKSEPTYVTDMKDKSVYYGNNST